MELPASTLALLNSPEIQARLNRMNEMVEQQRRENIAKIPEDKVKVANLINAYSNLLSVRKELLTKLAKLLELLKGEVSLFEFTNNKNLFLLYNEQMVQIRNKQWDDIETFKNRIIASTAIWDDKELRDLVNTAIKKHRELLELNSALDKTTSDIESRIAFYETMYGIR